MHKSETKISLENIWAGHKKCCKEKFEVINPLGVQKRPIPPLNK